jgi:putative membrane protein
MFAYESVWNGFHWWWIIPIAMMILCFIMMRGHRGRMTHWSRSHYNAESAREILDKRYALGEISREEYGEKKRDISQGAGGI